MTYTTQGGTAFTVEGDGNITIADPDGSCCTVPEDDLQEFASRHFTDSSSDDEDEDEESQPDAD